MLFLTQRQEQIQLLFKELIIILEFESKKR